MAERLNKIINELGINKTAFSKSIGVSRNHIYQLTNGQQHSVSRSVALLIEQKYNYRADWVMTGELPVMNLAKELTEKMKGMDDETLRTVSAYLDELRKGGCK